MLRLIFLLLWLPVAGLAQTYPDPLSDTVSDYAALLPPEDEARISSALQAAREETGVHIVLVTIASQWDYGGTGRLADFATGWFNTWGIGDATRNDGILILVSRGDREMRIALGEAYDVIWDGRAQRVIDTAMLPAFRSEDYVKGLEEGALLAIDQLARPFVAKTPVTEDSGFPQPSLMERYGGWGFGALFIGFFAWMIFGEKIRKVAARYERCAECGKRNMRTLREVTVAATQDTGGQGLIRRRCNSCKHSYTKSFTTLSLGEESRRKSKRSKSGGRSSSGFGGGRSGGGGASGKW